MSLFKIELANVVFEINSMYSYAYDFCHSFITDEKPDVKIQITPSDLSEERKRQELIGFEDKSSDSVLELNNIHRQISDRIIDYGVFMMHAAVISIDDSSFLFAAKSGTGKTTHLIRWLINSPNARIINGDKPFIITEGVPMACGSPWAGKERLYSNSKVPLKAIVFMERAKNNKMKRISFAEAFPAFLQQVYLPENEKGFRQTLKLMQSLNGRVSFWRFQCNNYKDDCFSVAYNALVNDLTN